MQGRHRNPAANDGSLPGATAGAHTAGLAIAVAIAVVMALAVPRIRLRLPVPVASRRARSLAWRLRMRNGDTMDVFAANDLEAADLLALARLDDDGAPPAVTPPPARDGRGRHVIRLADAGQVTASRAEVIAAAPRGQPGSGSAP